MIEFVYGICIVLLLLILPVILLPASQYKQGWLFTRKLTKSQFETETIQKLIKQYKVFVYLYICLTIIVFIPLFFVNTYTSIEFSYFMLMYILAVLLCETPYIWANTKLKNIKTQLSFDVIENMTSRPEEMENNWRYGIFYVNPDDSRWMVTKKLGVGMTLNFGHKKARMCVMVTSIVIFLGVAISMIPLFLLEMNEPKIDLTSNGTVEIDYFNYSSQFNYRDIKKITIIEEIPKSFKVNGLSTNKVMRGIFKLKGLGRGYVYVTIQTPPYILIQTNEGFFLLNEQTNIKTQGLYEDILRHKNSGVSGK